MAQEISNTYLKAKAIVLAERKIGNNYDAKNQLLSMIREGKDSSSISSFFNVDLAEGTENSELEKAIQEMMGKIKTSNKPMNKKKLVEELDIASQLLEEHYQKLSPMEKMIISLVESNDRVRLQTQLKITEALSKGIKSKKDLPMIAECIKKLKNDLQISSIKESAYKVCELKEAIQNLKEEDDASVIKLGNLKYLRDITISCVDDKNSPASIFIDFEVIFYPVGDNYSSLKDSLETLNRKFMSMGRNIVNQTIFWKGRAGKVFSGEMIWDGGIRLNNLKPGQKSIGKGELVLNTANGVQMPFIKFKEPVMEILRDLDALIPKWFDEVDPALQKSFLPGGKNAHVMTPKRKFAKTKSSADDFLTGDGASMSDDELDSAISTKIKK